jgi:hypothetical protein
MSSSAFDAAPPEIKQLWSDSLKAWKNHRYRDAAVGLMSLPAKAGNLSEQQVAELNQAKDEFGREAFAAANKGDDGAVQAVMTLKEGSSRRSQGTQ